MNDIIKNIEKKQLKNNIPHFKAGDTICVNINIIDKKNKIRKQNFEGVVIGKHNNGLSSTFTVRKFSYGEGVEKVFPIHSPIINWIKIKTIGVVRQSKIYYIRKLVGKAARIKTKLIRRGV